MKLHEGVVIKRFILVALFFLAVSAPAYGGCFLLFEGPDGRSIWIERAVIFKVMMMDNRTLIFSASGPQAVNMSVAEVMKKLAGDCDLTTK